MSKIEQFPDDLVADIKARMTRLNLTPKGVARIADMNDTAVRDILVGKSKSPQVGTVQKIYKALGINIGLISWDSEGSDVVDMRTETTTGRGTKVKELDLRAVREAELDTAREVEDWILPSRDIEAYTTAPERALKIVRQIGDSMEPTIAPGTPLLLDLGDRVPSPPGVFLIHDGVAPVVRRLEVLIGSEPTMVAIKCDNARYETHHRALADVHIAGRVIGRWARH